MTSKQVSITLLCLAAALVALDVVLAFDGIQGNTISQIVWSLSKQSPILPFVAGVLAGHLFWNS